MSWKTIQTTLTLILFSISIALSAEQPYQKQIDTILEGTNNYRQQNGLPTLQLDPQLSELALHHSQKMASTGQLNHMGFEERQSAIQQIWPKTKAIAENVAMNYGVAFPAKTAIEGWKKSQEHNANLLIPDATHIGIGIFKAPSGGYYFTQIIVSL